MTSKRKKLNETLDSGGGQDSKLQLKVAGNGSGASSPYLVTKLSLAKTAQKIKSPVVPVPSSRKARKLEASVMGVAMTNGKIVDTGNGMTPLDRTDILRSRPLKTGSKTMLLYKSTIRGGTSSGSSSSTTSDSVQSIPSKGVKEINVRPRHPEAEQSRNAIRSGATSKTKTTGRDLKPGQVSNGDRKKSDGKVEEGQERMNGSTTGDTQNDPDSTEDKDDFESGKVQRLRVNELREEKGKGKREDVLISQENQETKDVNQPR